MRDRSDITIVIIGGNTVAGHALSLLLTRAGYATKILKGPPTGPEDLPDSVDLLLVSPDLDDERRKGSLSILRGNKEGPRIPVVVFNATVGENVFAEEPPGSSWPVEIEGLVRAIETTLEGGAQGVPAMVANPVGEAALPQLGFLTDEFPFDREGIRSVSGVPVLMEILARWDSRIRINLRKYRKWGMPETSQGRRMEG